jgi:hypothetical protein
MVTSNPVDVSVALGRVQTVFAFFIGREPFDSGEVTS